MSPAPGLTAHEAALLRDLARLNLPPANWVPQRQAPDGAALADVVIVGAGMCGIAAAAALIFRGVRNIRILDRGPAGREGPWLTFARMETLRSPKHLTGPAQNIPALTFRAWYEAQHGEAGWEALGKIPNAAWMGYLAWLRHVLALPVQNGRALCRATPERGVVRLEIEGDGGGATLWTRRLVLATGRGGVGGLALPDGVERSLWPDRAAHSAEAIDFAALRGRRIAIIGGGASAWDNAATALEAGAAAVDMHVRRSALPQVNKWRGATYPGFFEGFPTLGDAERWALFSYIEDCQAPPPRETVLRTLRHPGFALHLGRRLLAARRGGGGVLLDFAGEAAPRAADFLILGTGFLVDLAACPELAELAPLAASWGDRYAPPAALQRPALARFPYLGADFALAEKAPGRCPDLARIHLFNYAATASLGALAGDIPGIEFGAARLASALAASFFREDHAALRDALERFDEPELEGTPLYLPPGRG